MRYTVAATFLVLVIGMATARAEILNNTDKFNATGAEVVTHRGSALVLPVGDNYLDKKSRMTCASDTGCSLVVQTLVFTQGGTITICTTVDDQSIEPPCHWQDSGYSPASTFQGTPALAKGDHIIRTTITVPWKDFNLDSYQLVYTLYQH